MAKLTKRAVDAIEPRDESLKVWDDELSGFGLRVQPSGVKTYILNYRTKAGRQRQLTIGRHGALTVAEARARAREMLASVADGKDPQGDLSALRQSDTVNQFLDRHLAEHVAKQNGLRMQASVKDAFDRLARPSIGALKLESVTRRDIQKMHAALHETPVMANMLLAYLSTAFNRAETDGLRLENSNPCKGVQRDTTETRERFLTADEFRRLGTALELARGEGLPWPAPPSSPANKHLPKAEKRRTPLSTGVLAVIRLLIYTGARRGEIIELEWSHVDFDNGALALPGRKGKARKSHPVSEIALAIMREISRVESSPWVFPRPGDAMRHLSPEVIENGWQRLRAHAGVEDVRLHDLRHTVATIASRSGANAFIVRDLLRHSTTAMTSRYANFDAAPVRATMNSVAASISAGMAARPPATPVPPDKPAFAARRAKAAARKK